jgi:RNA polymerase sigma-70 factor (ECF subfamily)
LPELDTDRQQELPAGSSDHPLRLTLEKHLAQLDPRSRNVFLLFEVEGFSHREIGEILDIREGTSKSILFEAKRGLQRLISQASGVKRS